MKTPFSICLCISMLSCLQSCQLNEQKKNKLIGERDRNVVLTKVSFSDTLHNFGNVEEGDTVSCYFVFQNTGKSDLTIEDVSSSCGCTIPNWPRRKIIPSATDSIEIYFSKKRELGEQHREVIVRANTEPQYTVLQIKANIVPNHSD